MNCPKCNEYYPESNSYCPSCGSENPNRGFNPQPNFAQQNQNPYQQPNAYQNQQNPYQQPDQYPNSQNPYAQFSQNPQGGYPNFQVEQEDNSNAYVKYWKNAFNFKGRTRRRDYWTVFAINTVIFFALIMVFSAAMTSAAFSYLESEEYTYTIPDEYFDNYSDDFSNYSNITPSTNVSYDNFEYYYYNGADDYYNIGDIDEFYEIVENIFTPAVVVSFILFLVFALVNFIPELAIAVRRLHDSGKSGAFYLICFIPYVGTIIFLVLMCLDSEPGSNQYGPNPKGVNPPPMNFGGYQNQYMGYGYQQPNVNYQPPASAPQEPPVNYDDIAMPIDIDAQE